jgi:predicted transcriptional regulator
MPTSQEPDARSRTPSPLEFEILKLLWQAEPTGQLPWGVRNVRQALAGAGRQLAHSSVITTLNIMYRKGYLRRTRYKNAYRYSPNVKQQQVSRQEVTNLLERVFDGSAQHLMLALLDSEKVSAEQIAEIKRIINRKTKGSRK